MTISRRHLLAALVLAAVAMTGLPLAAAATDIPAELPDPDGVPGDAAKPVKVYILAGQSNMVGMGELGGAKCRYRGIYLTADPVAPKGSMNIYPIGHYLISEHGIYTSSDLKAERGATVRVYAGDYDTAIDYDQEKPVKTETVPLGVVAGTLPTIDGPHTVVVRGFLEVPESHNYTVQVGCGDSANNATELDGQEVYRKEVGRTPTKRQIALEAGRRYPLKITYFQGGSTAFWMSQEDLVGKGDLEIVTRRDKRFPWLIDAEGNWTVRKDVYYQEARLQFQGSQLSAASNGKCIGPELGFGHVMGTYHDEQVLIIKTAQGNRSLGFDFRPPSSGRTDPQSEWESLEYKMMVEGVRKTLDDIESIVPGYQGQGHVIAGFAWWQGHKDAGASQVEYEKHLVNLICDIRKEFQVPDMPAVIATVGFGGHNMSDEYLQILRAQMAVGNPKKHPEFAGTVASVDTRSFWREADDSPTEQGYHYNRNAETYMLVGDALGRAMVELLEGIQRQAVTTQDLPPRHVDTPPREGEPSEKELKAAQLALAPIVIDGMAAKFLADNRDALLREASGERPERASQFLRGTMHRLTEFYRKAGVEDYNWRPFGPDLASMPWDYYSFDPPETQPTEDGKPRYRQVTCPQGMADWFAVDFNPAEAGWKKGLPPFGQLDGKLEPLSDSCTSLFCRCGVAPRTLWEQEVLLIHGTFDIPPLKEGHRYRIVVGGSAHVNSGEGYAIYINGKLLNESSSGVAVRQGGQPRGGHIYNDFREEFNGGKVTIAAISFLRYHHPRSNSYPPRGHFTLWLEEQKMSPASL